MLKLKSGYWIKAEPIGYSLNQEFKPTRGWGGQEPNPDKLSNRVVGYYGTVEDCLERYLDEVVHDEIGKIDIDNVLYLRGIIQAAKEEIKSIQR